MSYSRGLNEVTLVRFGEVNLCETEDEKREPNYGYEHPQDAMRDFEQTPNKLMMMAVLVSFMIAFWSLVFILIKFIMN